MFRKYGFFGAILIIFTQLNFFFKIEPFASFYFPLIWSGYILVVDALIFHLRKKSLIMNKPKEFVFILFASIPLWYVFEFFNIFLQNWEYNTEFTSTILIISATLILPALLETYQLIMTLRLFDNIKLKKSHKISKNFLYGMFGLGIISFLLPIFSPRYTFPLAWLSFFLLLDPINYINKQPSIIAHLKDRKLAVPLSLLLAGIIIGFLWEFWNYWAVPKWTYDIPFLNFFKIFEMPILGYLGYFPFSFELYAMYYFIKSLFVTIE